jgi:hypothetical protein
MSSIVIIVPPAGMSADTLQPRRVRLRDRVAARLRANGLDRRLADGAPPERSAALSLRARRLIEPPMAATMARSLHRLAREAREHRAARGPMPARMAAVREAAAELEDLARRLVAPRPAAVRGIAQVRLLLTDGAGPLYSETAGEDLAAAVRRARAALEIV